VFLSKEYGLVFRDFNVDMVIFSQKYEEKEVGSIMAKRSRLARLRIYHSIYEQIYKEGQIPIWKIAQNTGLPRSTVSRYISEMYEQKILVGPYLSMRAAPNYREYMYLANFRNPQRKFPGLSHFPSVVECALTFGDWNTYLVTSQPLDVQRMYGFQEPVLMEQKYSTITPKTEFTTWDAAFSKAYEVMSAKLQGNLKREVAPSLDWGEDQWKMYNGFNPNLREIATPTLKESGIRYESYRVWKKELETHCTIHTEFYPESYVQYNHHCFLVKSSRECHALNVVSCLPVTCRVVEMENHLLIFVNTVSVAVLQKLMILMMSMKTSGLLDDLRYASVLEVAHQPVRLGSPAEEDRNNRKECTD
jgi:predicted transcriptional regulator